ncbi:MAG: phosphoribosylglycinamide formyltransferase 2 [Gammaproteobacteria bacterium]|nr:phosphoribosylglycinamide formyltransferase 2 [Chloroflexota bacterium]MBS25126.1 phosphoribosylglycinamide formyltransferase 2 [Gammaproteobacteria bacterium]
MCSIGTALTSSATRLMLLGAGELGKEIAIEAQRLGVEVIAVDRYANAPAMQVAHKNHVISMTDRSSLSKVIRMEKPNIIVPEIEAIATDVLVESEAQGIKVIPTARATQLTMDREGIRKLAAEKLGLKTSLYRFASSFEEFKSAIEDIGIPCVIKPSMSSSGHGQSVLYDNEQISTAWDFALSGARGNEKRVIIEQFLEFDYEITLLTLRHSCEITFCAPIGHLQLDGDFRESWQPQPMPENILVEAQRIAKKITDELGGSGIFGVELFVKGSDVYFSEVSPRPHDTGMVTLISQDLSEFALHVRAILGLPIPSVQQLGPAASCALIVKGSSSNVSFRGVDSALSQPGTTIRLFGKPSVEGHRRMGVALALGDDIETARLKARRSAESISAIL